MNTKSIKLDRQTPRDRRLFEMMLIVVSIGMTYLVYRTGGYKLVALYLFFLPVVLSGYYLGRTHAGMLAFFCALVVTIVTAADTRGFMDYQSPVVIALALTIWAAVLGLTALLVGTLCDERAAKVQELHVAYVGVVEVLSRYLQGGDPTIKAKSIRVAELSQLVGTEMRLSRQEVDDIRVGALLHDLGNVEITTKLISRAMNTLESEPCGSRHTFMGTDLAHSLGSVLQSAIPLVLNQDDSVDDLIDDEDGNGGATIPIGARVIRMVRAYDSRVMESKAAPTDAIAELRLEFPQHQSQEVLTALTRVVQRQRSTTEHPPRELILSP